MRINLIEADEVVYQLASLLKQAQAARSVINDETKSRLINFVTIDKFCSDTGYTKNAVRAKIKNGVWLKDQVWVKAKDNRILINLEGYEKWIKTV